ncbi:MAG: hypothetical protein OQK12_18530 [Motiliproteus sp.]|nr:hypothetical protein [Motiliproteus sp.]MCW9053382.1 hypothetical protein [Motiliproteus sp.]
MKNHGNQTERAFLELLAEDIEQHPERLHPLTPVERHRIEDLVGDLSAPLPTDNDDGSS